MPEPLLYRPAEAADAIGVSRARAYELIAAGVIPSIRIGTSIRVPVDALRAWIKQQLSDREHLARVVVEEKRDPARAAAPARARRRAPRRGDAVQQEEDGR